MLRPKRRERAPVDYTRREEDRFFKEYGSFLALWCSFDLLIEVAIMRELRLTPQEASIVCAGIGFGAKINVLYSLLARNDGNAAKIGALKAAQKFAERNSFVHAFVLNDHHIGKFCLIRREVKDKYRARTKDLDSAGMTEHAITFGALFTDALDVFGIDVPDLDSYAHSIRSDVKVR